MTAPNSVNLVDRSSAIQLILSDVDGVLTDGRIIFNNQGIESKEFHIRDGFGVKLWRRAGYRFGIVTGRNSHVVQIRAAELGIEIVRQGTDAKLTAVQEICRELQLPLAHVCYIGDDLPDLPAIRGVGLGVAVADACEEVRAAAAFVTERRGGDGAVRETIEMILKNQRRWDDLAAKYER